MTVEEMRDELDELCHNGHGQSNIIVLTPEWEKGHLVRTLEHEPNFVCEFDTAWNRRPNTVFFYCPY